MRFQRGKRTQHDPVGKRIDGVGRVPGMADFDHALEDAAIADDGNAWLADLSFISPCRWAQAAIWSAIRRG